MSDLLKELNAVFKRHTGKPITMLAYEVDELLKRVSNIEDTLRATMPTMAATALKVEALATVIVDSQIVQPSALQHAQQILLLESKKCI